jgi:acetyl esterase/lipase
MTSASIDMTTTSFSYEAFDSVHTATLHTPAEPPVATAIICTGSAMLSLDPSHAAVAGLETLANALEHALLRQRVAVVRPDPIRDAPNPEALLEATTSFLDAAFTAGGSIGRHFVIALSAAAPLLSIAAAQRGLDAMVLVAPPILEVCSNRPDRVDQTLIDHLGLAPDIAAALGALAPMNKGTQGAPSALLVHGAADTIVPPGDSIGWRASLAVAGIHAERIEVAFAQHDLSPEPCRNVAVEAIVSFLTSTT